MPGSDPDLSADDGAELALGYGREAIDTLLRALAAGQDPVELASAPELEYVRDHARWPELERALRRDG